MSQKSFEWLSDKLDITSHEVEAQKIRTKYVENPEQWLHHYQGLVSKLPDGGEVKRAIETLLKGAANALAQGDEELAKLCIVKVWYKLESADIEARTIDQTEGGRKGGSKPKRKPWAEAIASRLVNETQGCTEAVAWEMLPDSHEKLEIELKDYDAEVYRDGDTLYAVNSATGGHVGKLTKNSFFKYYYRPAKKGQ